MAESERVIRWESWTSGSGRSSRPPTPIHSYTYLWVSYDPFARAKRGARPSIDAHHLFSEEEEVGSRHSLRCAARD
jgi:hypothetical protein